MRPSLGLCGRRGISHTAIFGCRVRAVASVVGLPASADGGLPRHPPVANETDDSRCRAGRKLKIEERKRADPPQLFGDNFNGSMMGDAGCSFSFKVHRRPRSKATGSHGKLAASLFPSFNLRVRLLVLRSARSADLGGKPPAHARVCRRLLPTCHKR